MPGLRRLWRWWFDPSVDSEKAIGFPILHTYATTDKREGMPMAYPSGLGRKDSAIGGENVYGRAETSTGPGGALPLYSITQVYLSPEFHLGEAIISKAVIPRSEFDVTRATPTAKGVPPQFSKSSV